MEPKLQKEINSLPESTGVYLFFDSQNTVLYVGKAVNLKDRVRQYFFSDTDSRIQIRALINRVRHIEVIETASEFDALLLEAKLISQNKPKYNIVVRDDKSYLYIVIKLNKEVPQIQILRKDQMEKTLTFGNIKVFGPFQSTSLVRSILSSLRHIIPYCTQKKQTGKKCFYSHMGLCNPCPSLLPSLKKRNDSNLLIKQYRKNISRICDVLSGKSVQVLYSIEREMIEISKKEKFEDAMLLRNQIENLKNLHRIHFDPSIYMRDSSILDVHFYKEELSLISLLKPFFPLLQTLHRIECIDISNISGKLTTGSIIVFTDRKSDKKSYRRFRIQEQKRISDTKALELVLERRFRHPEWPFPDLIVVDGGKPQLKTVISVLYKNKKHIPVIGLAKRHEQIVLFCNNAFHTLSLPYTSLALQLIQRIRDEAHRFAKVYHMYLRRKYITGKDGNH